VNRLFRVGVATLATLQVGEISFVHNELLDSGIKSASDADLLVGRAGRFSIVFKGKRKKISSPSKTFSNPATVGARPAPLSSFSGPKPFLSKKPPERPMALRLPSWIWHLDLGRFVASPPEVKHSLGKNAKPPSGCRDVNGPVPQSLSIRVRRDIRGASAAKSNEKSAVAPPHRRTAAGKG